MADETNVVNDVAAPQSEGNQSEVTQQEEMKSFTQTQLNKMFAKEKTTGEQHVLNMFGLKSKDDISSYVNNYNNISNELNQLKNEKILSAKGIASEDMEYVAFKVSKMVDDKTNFESALDKFLTDNPKYSQQKSGVTVSFGASQTGGSPATTTHEQMNDFLRSKGK